jgi:ribosomal protein S18 acetylase RimI-like enzyme
MLAYKLRPFRTDDQAVVRRMVLDGLASRFGFANESLTPDLDDLQAYYLDAGGEVWVAETPNSSLTRAGIAQIVGCGALMHEAGRPEALRIVRMSVRADSQRRGIARAVGECLIERARARGADCVLVETNDDWHSALGLYQSLGFQETHRLYVPEFDFTEVHMALWIR